MRVGWRAVECVANPWDNASDSESGDGVTRRMVECALYELTGRVGDCDAEWGSM